MQSGDIKFTDGFPAHVPVPKQAVIFSLDSKSPFPRFLTASNPLANSSFGRIFSRFFS